jgi:hypothetical protein
MATPPAGGGGAGDQTQARIKINAAVRDLIGALQALNKVDTEEAGAILTALKALEKVTPEVEEGVSQSEVRSLLANTQTARPPAGPPGGGPAGPIGPRPPRPMAVGGPGFGANMPVPAPPVGMGP